MANSNALAHEAAPQPVERPIDMEHLRRQALGDPALEAEILMLYADMSRIYFSRVEASRNPEELAQHLHTLKSAAAGIGAWSVRDLTRLAEDDIRAGKVNPERIDDIALAVNECAEFISELLAEPQPG
jgi:HPt (histidine-containing phosphotransfer) domain-containing protein